MSVLKKDTELEFPHVLVIEASAGSGKTHTLAKRYIQFILSDQIPYNDPRHILAITFTNNAANEMKERILEWLKKLALDIDENIKRETLELVSIEPDRLPEKAEQLIERILENYDDFQIQTIDSFANRILKASTIELGFPPDFDITTSINELLDYTMSLMLREIFSREANKKLADLVLEAITDIIKSKRHDNLFPWNPVPEFLRKFKSLIEKEANNVGELNIKTPDWKAIHESIERLRQKFIELSKYRGNPFSSSDSYEEWERLLFAEKPDIMSILKKRSFILLKGDIRKKEYVELYRRIKSEWFETLNREKTLIASHYVFAKYAPYRELYPLFKSYLDGVKRRRSLIYIKDINKLLVDYIKKDLIPEIYCRLGNRLHHFLIDEFQDTDRVQWENLKPLIEEAVSQAGSFFAVGDLKQAIYMFKNADYRIMRNLCEEIRTGKSDNPWLPGSVIGSAEVVTLDRNYRSGGVILDYVNHLFKEKLKDHLAPRVCDYDRTGLTNFRQYPLENRKEDGYVKVIKLIKDKENPDQAKPVLIDLLKNDILNRYRCSDVAILALKNEQVEKIVEWLTDEGIPAASFSSLDIRKRKIIVEIAHLLKFLDSPIDDLAFASFLLGEIMAKALSDGDSGMSPERLRDFVFKTRREKKGEYLYVALREDPELNWIWKKFFEDLYKKVGFLPLYDLTVLIYRKFRIFENFPDETGSLIKLLDVINHFEASGLNNIKEFCKRFFNHSDPELFSIDLPDFIDAVKVMTFHKSKGLGFPVVINLITEEGNRVGNIFLVKEGGKFTVYHITKEILENASLPELEMLRDEAVLDNKIQTMNLYYVICTRAKDELYNIVITKERSSKNKDKQGAELINPITIFEEYESGHKHFPVDMEHRTPPYTPASLSGKIQFDISESFTAEGGEWNIYRFLETKRGEFFHSILKDIEFIDGDITSLVTEAVRKVLRTTKEKYDESQVIAILVDFLNMPQVKEWFEQKPGRTVEREVEYVDSNGRTARFDRVVHDGDTITVIDYKTGEYEEEYSNQVRRYMRILRDVYRDREIKGYIAYIDQKEIEEIEL